MISPLLANIYLHYAFDLWANRWRQREATGDMIILRYADDTVVGLRRSQRDRTTWDRIAQLVEEWLPKPRILHPWPSVRFAVKYPR